MNCSVWLRNTPSCQDGFVCQCQHCWLCQQSSLLPSGERDAGLYRSYRNCTNVGLDLRTKPDLMFQIWRTVPIHYNTASHTFWSLKPWQCPSRSVFSLKKYCLKYFCSNSSGTNFLLSVMSAQVIMTASYCLHWKGCICQILSRTKYCLLEKCVMCRFMQGSSPSKISVAGDEFKFVLSLDVWRIWICFLTSGYLI